LAAAGRDLVTEMQRRNVRLGELFGGAVKDERFAIHVYVSHDRNAHMLRYVSEKLDLLIERENAPIRNTVRFACLGAAEKQ
jgi:hypothetical protein